jgi:hypothetical protein
MKTRIRKRMRLFLLEKEDIFQIKLFLLMANLSRLSLGSSVSWEKYVKLQWGNLLMAQHIVMNQVIIY